MKKTPSEIIDDLGGTGEVARFFEIRPSSVSEWRRNGIPQARMMHLRSVRPDVVMPESRHKAKTRKAA